MTDTPSNTPRDNATGPASTGTSPSGDLSGISEMFGLKDGQTSSGDTGTRTDTDTVGRWVAATEAAAQPPEFSSRLVHGRYRLIAELGEGGMGVTYRAWDTQAHMPVVVKMPKREVRSDGEAMQRFRREIDALLAVPHKYIVPITDHGDDAGCPFVVMRFLPGGSLADYRRRDEAGNPIRNPPGMLYFWLPGVAAALDHIHARGMLHRDVKPGNIFLDGFLKPYLGDFGIAKVVDESGGLTKEQTLTATKMAVGTPEYMAPELFKPRSKPDGWADQYALAVTVYEMLSGEKPFKGDRAHIVVEHSGLPVPPLAGKVPGLPQRVCLAVEKGLAKKAEDRFATCSEFAAAVLAELGVLPPEPDTVRLLCPGCKNILKLPQKAAGKTGRCPRCREAMDVAADLGSLWLEAEERGGGVEKTETASELESLIEPEKEPRPALQQGRWGAREWAAVALAMLCGLAAGYPWGASVAAAKARKETLRVETTLNHAATDKNQLTQRIDEFRRSQEALAAENRRLAEALADARAAKPAGPEAAPAARSVPDRVKNSIGMEFIRIPKGEFLMGEGNQVRVTLSRDFLLGKTEVTREQWQKVMGTKPWGGEGGVSDADLPAVDVSWDDAKAFCVKLTDRERAEGRLRADEAYRLPTEAEWEYACRAGTTTAYSFGDDESKLGNFAWYDRNSGNKAHAVGMKQANPWGVHDMHGNVWEWCSDWYEGKLAGGVDPVGPDMGSLRVRRGGSWRIGPVYCQSARRFYYDPSDRYGYLGFRVARSQSVK